MTDWIQIDDETDWQKLPNKYELLYENGKTKKIIIYGGAAEANLIVEGEGSGVATHWRPIKK